MSFHDVLHTLACGLHPRLGQDSPIRHISTFCLHRIATLLLDNLMEEMLSVYTPDKQDKMDLMRSQYRLSSQQMISFTIHRLNMCYYDRAGTAGIGGTEGTEGINRYVCLECSTAFFDDNSSRIVCLCGSNRQLSHDLFVLNDVPPWINLRTAVPFAGNEDFCRDCHTYGLLRIEDACAESDGCCEKFVCRDQCRFFCPNGHINWLTSCGGEYTEQTCAVCQATWIPPHEWNGISREVYEARYG
jgi:hypothetical protein